MPEHREDIGQRLSSAGIERDNTTSGNGALHREDVGHTRDWVLVGIFGRAGDLERAVDAVQRGADGLLGRALHAEGHGRASFSAGSVRSSSVRTRVLRASGTLKALPGSGWASASSASAARWNTSSDAGA